MTPNPTDTSAPRHTGPLKSGGRFKFTVPTTPNPHREAGHTPGPWRATPNGYGRWFVHGGPDLISDGTGTSYQALVCGGNNHDTLTEANARLIAAAPELYEVLADIMENPIFQTAIGGNPNMVEDLMARASAALAKARGESA
jgi:hypothetical protein